MKVEELLLRVAIGENTFWQGVRILKRSARHVWRLIQRYRQKGFAACWMVARGGPASAHAIKIHLT